jgi:hypothetical protein
MKPEIVSKSDALLYDSFLYVMLTDRCRSIPGWKDRQLSDKLKGLVPGLV